MMKTKIQFKFGTLNEPSPLSEPETWEAVRPIWKQVHGVAVAEVNGARQPCGHVDALWTQKKDILIAVKTADCIPILLYRRDHAAVAAIHAGWRGVLQRIVPRFFEALPKEFSNPRDWVAVIGPSNRACCYEFGESDLALFHTEFKDLSAKELSPVDGHLDVMAALMNDLRALKLEVESIHPDCTFCSRDANQSPRYLSYRRGDRDSRQYSMIQIQTLESE